ncbi:hypothetical protein [Streptomyces sp. S1]|uniref:hypothetical protein n=1 Tax=Streptomyces sp. S1 TaxID=718288 RepID=UPI003D71831A
MSAVKVFAVVLCTLGVLNAVVTAKKVGQPRRPYNGMDVFWSAVMTAGFVWIFVSL